MGTPLGRDMEVGTAVAGDPDIWWRMGLISSGTMMLLGLNGNGKSTVALRMMYGQVHRGMAPGFFDPIKNEYAEAAAELGCTSISIGPRSRDRINPFDLGALGEAADRIGGEIGAELREQAISQAIDLVVLLVLVNRGRPLEDIEETALAAMVRWIIDKHGDAAWIGTLEQAFNDPPLEVVHQVGRLDAAEFQRDFRGLRDAVIAVSKGTLGHLVGGRESVRLPVDGKGFCFDTSSIPQSNSRLLSAAMLSTWQVGFSTMDAHWELAQHELRKQREAAECGDHYEPQVRWSGYSVIQDELWYPMRACEGIVDRIDRVGRTQRGLGVATIQIMHTPKDSLSLPNPADREKAKGLMQRVGVLGLMALSLDDLHFLNDNVMPLNRLEIARVNSFNSSTGWTGKLRRGRKAPPAGAGKVLLKVPGELGVPVQMTLTDIEDGKHDTEKRSRQTGDLVDLDSVEASA